MGSIVPGNVTQLPARKAVVVRQQVIPREGIRPLPRILYYIVCTIIAVLFVFPLFWSIFTSLKPAAEANASPANIIPSHLSFDNYIHLVNYGSGLGTYLFNSGTVAIGTVVGTLMLSTLAGYGFSRFNFPGKNAVFMVILSTLMIPFQSILTPLFLVLHSFHLQNTLLGLALVYITFQLPFGIFVMRNAFDTVPRELEEAGLVDGCTTVSVVYRVMLTLVLPGIVTVALFAFFNSWNEFLAALIFMNDSSKYTLPILLLNAQSGLFGSIDWGALQAGVAIAMFPCLVLFLLLQKYYISGLVAGSVKG
ncbi:MAG: carbohydrate ABC transporter permease [Ktedonobacteraceae bacterium]